MDFLIRCIKDLKRTGAVAPSSKFLAQDLVTKLQNELLDERCRPLKILEIGPGTGPLTKEIARLLRPKDQLDIVEVQRPFYEIISDQFQATNINVYFSDILKFDVDYSYDYIFSSLPYENMSKEIIRSIWEKKLSLCTSDSYICYFKYINFRDFKCQFEEQVVKQFISAKKFVIRNIPPARLYFLKINESAISLRETA